MEYSRSLVLHFILEYSRMLQNILKYIVKNIQKYLRIFGNILAYIFWNNWKVVPERYCISCYMYVPMIIIILNNAAHKINFYVY